MATNLDQHKAFLAAARPKGFTILLNTLAVLLAVIVAGCGSGGGGGSPPPEDNVTITGLMDDGSGTAPIAGAVCRFLDAAGAEEHSDITDAGGNFRLVVSPEVRGNIVCSPQATPNLALTTFSSTIGADAGITIDKENVTPATTVVADIIRQERATNPELRKAELLSDIATGQDPNLEIVVGMAERLYRAMFAQQINVSFNGDRDNDSRGDGGGGNDGGGASGDAGGGADFSPLAQATCEFVVGNTLTTGERFTSAALADFFADGELNRPDLAAVAAEVNQGADAAAVRDAFTTVFPETLGQPIATVTDEEGRYTLPVPPDMSGYIRCTPEGHENLMLGAYFPGRAVGELVEGQDVTPASTVFSTDIAPRLSQRLAAVQENYNDDKAGLQVLLSGPNLPAGPVTGINLGTDTRPADNNVGLVAFAVTGLFNAFNKNGFDLDYPAAIANLRENAGVTSGFLEAQGVPAAEAPPLATLINGAITAAGGSLGTGLSTAWSTGRINLTVMDDRDGSLVENAVIGIGNTDLDCQNCNSPTDANGQLTLVVGALGMAARDVEVVVSGVPGFEETPATVPLLAFATVDLEIRLSDLVSDTQAPMVAITTPSQSPYATTVGSLAIQGTASDDDTVSLVRWSSDQGGSGDCDGTTAWTASGIALSLGTNVITITAQDTAGNESVATLTVIYSLPPPPPPPPTPDVDIIIDNTDSGFQTVSDWTSRTTWVGGYYGANYIADASDIHNNSGLRTARWTPNIPSYGSYDVYMWWPAHPDYVAAGPVSIRHAGGTANHTVNQKQNGFRWNLIGRYTFNQGTIGYLEINASAFGHTIADAVRFRSPNSSTPLYPPEPAGQIVVDNTDSGFSTDSSWSVGSILDNFYGSNYLHDGTAAADSSGRYARWTPNIPSTGEYRVDMRWVSYGVDYAQSVPVRIVHANGTENITINQRQNGSIWNDFGTYTFNRGTGGYVEINASSHGYTTADAVRFVPKAGS